MSDLSERWSVRQDLLGSLLRAHGAGEHDWRVDLGAGRFWWQDPASGRPSVVARTRVLCSWALSNGSMLAGWANRSLPESARVPAVPGIAPSAPCADEGEAWARAFAIADGTGAEFIYRAPNAQLWIFLGLWDVRTATAGEAPFEPGPPWAHVAAVLDNLAPVGAPAELRLLARNYARTWIEDEARRGTRWEAPLRAFGQRLAALAERDDAALREGIGALAREVKGIVA